MPYFYKNKDMESRYHMCNVNVLMTRYDIWVRKEGE
jgi:hypothetical protein